MLDDLGLADAVLSLDHPVLERMVLHGGGEETTLADFSRLRVRFPYIAMIPQARFLDLLAQEARQHAAFDLRLGCRVKELLIEDGRVVGTVYQKDGQRHELRAALTVAADGRGSRVARLAGFQPIKNATAMDVMWIVLPRSPGEELDTGFRVGAGRTAGHPRHVLWMSLTARDLAGTTVHGEDQEVSSPDQFPLR